MYSNYYSRDEQINQLVRSTDRGFEDHRHVDIGWLCARTWMNDPLRSPQYDEIRPKTPTTPTSQHSTHECFFQHSSSYTTVRALLLQLPAEATWTAENCWARASTNESSKKFVIGTTMASPLIESKHATTADPCQTNNQSKLIIQFQRAWGHFVLLYLAAIAWVGLEIWFTYVYNMY